MPKRYIPQVSYDVCIAEVARLFRGGLSLDELATRYGARRATIRRWLEDAGVRTTSGACIGLAGEELALALARQWCAGVTVRGIVRETGLTEPRVSKLITSAGVDTTVRWERRQVPKEAVRDRFLAGLPRVTITDLAAEFELRPSAIRHILDKAGIRSRRCLVGFDRKDMVAALVTRRRLEMSIQQLSVDTGIAEAQLFRLTRPPDAPPIRRRHRAGLSMTSAQLVAAYRGGSTLAELVARVDSSKGMVRNILLDAVVTLRPPVQRPRNPSPAATTRRAL